jgi:hypothetical protein
MSEKLKKELNKILKSTIVGLAGIGVLFIIVIPVAHKSISMQMYKIGADQIFKPIKECNIYKDRYIDEMAKQKEGHPEVIVEEAKVNKCKK